MKIDDLNIQPAIRLEKKLGIPKGFFVSLLDDNDWSFVIKGHAFVESILTLAISRCLEHGKKESISNIISRLQTANARYGKLAFAKYFDMLVENEIKFIRKLSELRNQLVHNAENINFTFEKCVNQLSDNQKNNFLRCFTTEGAWHSQKNNFDIINHPEKAIKDLKKYIFCGIIDITHALEVVILQSDVRDVKFGDTNEKAFQCIIEDLINDTCDEE